MTRWIVATLLFSACGGSSDQPTSFTASTDTLPGGIVRVMSNGPTAWTDTNGWKLVLDRTIAPAEGSPGELMDPQWLFLRADGSLLVGDMDPPRFALYDSTGTFIRTLGGVGDGPGEFRAPHPALLGDTLVVHDPQQTRITLLTLSDSLLRTFPSICCHFGPPAFVDQNGIITVQNSRRMEDETSRAQWVRFNMQGVRLDSILVPLAVAPKMWTWKRSFPGGGIGISNKYVPLAPRSESALLRNGNAVFGSTATPTFTIVRNGVDTLRVFGRSDVVPTPAPAGLRDSLFTQATENPEFKKVASLGDIPETLPTWNNIAEDADGNFWVYTGGEGRPRLFEVYDSAGVFLGTVPCPWEVSWATTWSKDRVAILDRDADDFPRIRIYRVIHNSSPPKP